MPWEPKCLHFGINYIHIIIDITIEKMTRNNADTQYKEATQVKTLESEII